MASDGKVTLSTALDNSGIEKDTRKMGTSLRGQAAKIAAEYRKQGMSMSDAMKKAWSEVERSSGQSSKQVGDDIKENVGDGVEAVTGKLGGLASVVGELTGKIAIEFAKAVVAITKQAVDAYADYEQLVGGVETLFKDSASKVVAYAEDAFYTVGISANEYMETVTSFSASLISSLGGDTEKAADVANMALVDMADNANKMGSEMESIQNAYQGFAKQNYTMLDNLKLGYGGTKTEMERLLKDAQALTGVEYDINNLADVYSAIHAIQGEMGISGRTAEEAAEIYENTGREVSETIGTTAKEAEGTISGSAAMTAAAWKNVLTAIAGGGDLDKSINNLVYSVSKYFENIVPVVQRALAGIGELIEKIAPMLVENLATALIKAIPSLLSAVYQMVIGLVKGIYQGIAALFSGSAGEIAAQINDDGTEALGEITDGYKNAENAAEDAEEAAKRYLAGFDEITKIGGDESAAASDTVVETSVGSISAGSITVDGEVSDEASPKVQGFVQSVVEKIKQLLEPLREIDFTPAVEAFGRLKDALEPITSKLFDGLGWAYTNILVPLAAWTIEGLLPTFLDAMSGAFGVLNSVLEALQPLAEWLWINFLQPIAEWTGGIIVGVLGAIADGLTAVSKWISEHQALVEGFVIVVGSFAAAWALVNGALAAWNAIVFVWNNLGAIATAVTTAFGAAVNFLTSPITLITLAIGALIAVVVLLAKNWDTVKEVAGKIWDGIKSVWKNVADWFKKYVTDPIFNFFKNMVNGIIGFINGMIATVVSGVNFIIGALNTLSFDVPDWVPLIGGQTWGFNISEVTAPQIPYLAQGAVLPANKPFLAMVGDQRHGTNVEAPLSTIQEAVALVMEDMIQSNIAGHEATVAVLKEILEAVLGIHIGDDVIGQAVARYNAKMAIIRGGGV